MEIIIRQKAGVDYPKELKENEEVYRKFLIEIEKTVRKRLELREIDKVIIEEIEG